MTDAAFIFALAVGLIVLAGLLITAHIGASRLAAHREQRLRDTLASATAGLGPTLTEQPDFGFRRSRMPTFYGGVATDIVPGQPIAEKAEH